MVNVLVLNADLNGGVGYYRFLSPHLSMDNPDLNIEVRNLTDHTLPILDENYLRNFQVIIYNKKIPFNKEELEGTFRNILKKYNIKLIYDIDDYWNINGSHLNYKMWKETKGGDLTLNEIVKADYVVTTTKIFADEIKEFNENVVVIPNAVNLNEYQWISRKTESDKIRFLWGGGISHMPDLRLLTDSFKSFDKEFLQKAQVFLCGFDLRMQTKDGMAKSDWRSSPWTFFEDIFTNQFRYIKNPEYHNWLRKYEDGGTDTYGVNPNFIDEFYQRRFTKPVTIYGTMYNEANVALAPLKSGMMFNLVKSQLKVIEAGAHKCPIIASNYGPYTIDDIEGKNDGKQKGFLIDESNKLGWTEKMKWFVNNPSAIEDFGNNLYEYVKTNYSTKVVNKLRADFYKNIANK